MLMIKKEKILFYSSLLMILSGAGIVYLKGNTGTGFKKVELKSVKKANGWGYQITVGKNYTIQQDNIPGITGYKPFINEEEALKAGRLVVEKLKQGKLPTLNSHELEAVNIHY
jgi:Domain of unknown function (DUF4907)